MKRVSLFILLCLLMMSAAVAEKNEAIVIYGTIIDGTGAAPVKNGALVISGDRIAGVGEKGKVNVPAGAKVFEVKGGTILPGFINTHVHTNGFKEDTLKTWAREGVTTVRDLGLPKGVPPFKTRDQRRKNPEFARVLTAGPIVSAPEGFVPQVALFVESPEDAVKKITQLLDRGADVIKVGLNGPYKPVLSLETLKAITTLAHKRGKPVAAHNINTGDFDKLVEAGVDDIHHLMLNGPQLTDEQIKRMIDRGIVWVPTLEAVPPKFRDKKINQFKRFVRAGGKVAFGNDSGWMPHVAIGMPIKDIKLLHEAGMTPGEIIVAATGGAARLCRVDKELGTLEKGKTADILVVKGNPLQNLDALTRPLLVIHEGTVIRKEF